MQGKRMLSKGWSGTAAMHALLGMQQLSFKQLGLQALLSVLIVQQRRWLQCSKCSAR
jgi:hypothetical protein